MAPRIMIVEDEWAIAADLMQSLKRLDYEVTSIEETGEGAIRRAKEDMPDLVLMDISLKEKMNGIEAAEQIHSTFNIPHIFVTAYADKQMLEKAKITEPFGYILKPFDEKELHAAIEMTLYKHRLEMKLIENHRQLQSARDDLEILVKEKTNDLETTNKSLLMLIQEHENTSNALKEKNIALKVLLKQREEDKDEMEQNILSNIKLLVHPYISKLKKNKALTDAHSYLDIIESNLSEITSPFSKKLLSHHMSFTPQEIKVANLIKDGNQDKDIMEVLNISFETVKTHRQNIRKKLGIYGKKTNMRTALEAFFQ